MWTQIENAKSNKPKKTGFTLIELMIALLISAIIVSAVGVMVADSSGWFSDSYSKINSQPAIESLLARKTFERIIRQSAYLPPSINSDEDEVVIYYFSPSGDSLDSYARFYLDVAEEKLKLDKGLRSDIDDDNYDNDDDDEIICENVSECIFKSEGSAVQMILMLDDGKNKHGSVTSAIMHN